MHYSLTRFHVALDVWFVKHLSCRGILVPQASLTVLTNNSSKLELLPVLKQSLFSDPHHHVSLIFLEQQVQTHVWQHTRQVSLIARQPHEQPTKACSNNHHTILLM